MPYIVSRFNPNTNLWEIGYWEFGMFTVMGSYPELSNEQKHSYSSEEYIANDPDGYFESNLRYYDEERS